MTRGRRNYSLVINSRFRPFSYDEMLKPLLQQTQAQQALEDAYDTAGTQAAAMSAYINKDTDPNAYQKYQTFMQGLAARAGELSAYGLTPSSRQGLSSMRTMYGTEIVPIQQAIQRRQQFADEQRKLGPNYVFDNDASTMSLDDLIANPQLSYSARNLAEIAKESSQVFAQLQKDLSGYALLDGAKDPRIKSAYKDVFVKRHGITPEEAASFISSVKQGLQNGQSPEEIARENKRLGIIWKNLYDAQGMDTENWDALSRQRVSDAILKGVTYGIGQTDVSLQDDPEALADLKARTARRMADDTKPTTNKQVKLNPVALRNLKEVDKSTKEFNDWVAKGYLTTEGKLTPQGKRASVKVVSDNRRIKEMVGSPYRYTSSGQLVTTQPFTTQGTLPAHSSSYRAELTAFGEYLKNKSGYDATTDINLDTSTGKYEFKTGSDKQWKQSNYDKLASSVEFDLGGYDVEHTTGYSRTISSEAEQKAIKQQIRSNQFGNNEYETVSYSDPKTGYKKSGTITKEELKNATVYQTISSPYGVVARMTVGDKDVEVLISSGSYKGSRATSALKASQQLTTGIEHGWIPEIENGEVVTDRDGNIKWASQTTNTINPDGTESGWITSPMTIATPADIKKMETWRDDYARMGVYSGAVIPFDTQIKNTTEESDDVNNYIDLLEGLWEE